MSDQPANQGGNAQDQQNQAQPTGNPLPVNPLLNRPMNPKLDIRVNKGTDIPIIESIQKVERQQDGGRITEQKKEEGKST